jgi:hypothetical protein
MALIAADGSVLKGEVITSRKPVDRDRLLTRRGSEKVTTRSQAHGFVETVPFDMWFKKKFLPELALRRAKYEYDRPAVLFPDRCSGIPGCQASRWTKSSLEKRASIRTRHIASDAGAFLEAAVHLHVVKRVELSGICVVADAGLLYKTARPGKVIPWSAPGAMS